MMAKSFFRRIADEAKPPVAWGRPECGPLDYAVDVLLDELVKSGSWLDLELKRLFLALLVNLEEFDDPDLDDPIIALMQSNLHKFAAMDPVVDLGPLRGMRVHHTKPYLR